MLLGTSKAARRRMTAWLHGCEGAAISVTALSSFRSAIARAVWSKKLPMTNTPALLSMLDGPLGI